RLAEQLAALRDAWEEGAIAPQTPRPAGPELLVGGLSDATFARVARYADGYVHGGGPPRAFARMADKARAAWLDAGRPGGPRLWAQGYFAVGDEATVARGQAAMRHYYAFTGPFAEKIVAGLLTTPQALAQFVRGYAEAGCDELVLLPAVADLAQVERLADLLWGGGAERPPLWERVPVRRGARRMRPRTPLPSLLRRGEARERTQYSERRRKARSGS